MTIGNRIRQIRGEESQEAFANRLKINKNTLGFYERDERTPNATFVADICKWEGVAADWLLYGEGPMRRSATGVSSPVTKPQAEAQVISPVQAVEEDWKMSEMVTMTVEVLESDTVYRGALASNIRAFHQAVRSERTLANLEERVVQLEAREDRMVQLESRMAELERENRELKLTGGVSGRSKAVGEEG